MNSARMRAVKLSVVGPQGTTQLSVAAGARRLPECIWRPIGLTDRVNHDAVPAQADDPTAKEQITAIGARRSVCLAQPRTARPPESRIISGETGHCRQRRRHHDRAIPCLPPPMSAIQELLGPRHKWTQGIMIGKVRRNFLSFCAFPAGRQPGYRLSICDRQTAISRPEIRTLSAISEKECMSEHVRMRPADPDGGLLGQPPERRVAACRSIRAPR